MERQTEPATPSSSGAAGARQTSGERRGRRLRVAALTAGGILGVAGLAFLAGFAAFTARISSHEPQALRPADGIVVLTGGASRVADGVQLLASGHGKRMLISGVNRTTSTEELRRTLPTGDSLLDCCVDLGRKALNTWGNAIEVAEWTRSRHFRSLVVVTSTWHMPRALFELGRMLPDVELISYPVVTDRMQDAHWWSEPQTAKLLFKEYVKYLLAHAKIRPLQAVANPERDTEAEKATPANTAGPQASATH